MKLSEEIKDIIKANDCQCKICRNKKRIYENMLPKIEQLEKISKEMYDYLKYLSDKEALNYECLNEIDIIIKKWEEIIK